MRKVVRLTAWAGVALMTVAGTAQAAERMAGEYLALYERLAA